MRTPVRTPTTVYRLGGVPEQVISLANISASHLRVLEESVLLNAFNEHKSVGTVSGPVQQVLH